MFVQGLGLGLVYCIRLNEQLSHHILSSNAKEMYLMPNGLGMTGKASLVLAVQLKGLGPSSYIIYNASHSTERLQLYITSSIVETKLKQFLWDIVEEIESGNFRVPLRLSWYGTPQQQDFIRDCSLLCISADKYNNTVYEFYYEVLVQWFTFWPIVTWDGDLIELYEYILYISAEILQDIERLYRFASRVSTHYISWSDWLGQSPDVRKHGLAVLRFRVEFHQLVLKGRPRPLMLGLDNHKWVPTRRRAASFSGSSSAVSFAGTRSASYPPWSSSR
ncbi:hypothetical protein DFP72DRAFT_858348 [Ephemerocybe angulata]|uniref:Uncharacterized protein n=1 Tax=Ephemerocybe angulata TaxID=980116 RepID=A0A8H6HB99_9AGAR|nr:hypothetical protein DFP72DRAFT_858348 [Tulosesus angulatus]